MLEDRQNQINFTSEEHRKLKQKQKELLKVKADQK